ncbi:MAG: ADP-ribosylglycohydrolase family protein [Pirellulaceae bacterium]|nr:ADP-ribosylglycohydrolase family protein [Pirellulaceae bacterium]
MQFVDQIAGSLLGTAVGDAVGLPLENLSRRRLDAWLGNKPLRHRFLLGYAMVSDDTEHTCLVAQSLIRSGNDAENFGSDLARRLKWWLAGLPAGTGRATARACIRLWMGIDWRRSGVWSAGNGPAMRAAIIGVAMTDTQQAIKFTRASSQITHSDPKATYGALAIASLANHFAHRARDTTVFDGLESMFARWINANDDDAAELMQLINAAIASARQGESTQEFAQQAGWERGVTGYTYQTVPVAVHACLRHPENFRAAIDGLVRCGGDVDSTAAIAGGILGAKLGEDGIPDDWLNPLIEWPRSKAWMRQLARVLADTRSTSTDPADSLQSVSSNSEMPTINPLAQLVRNLFFLAVVLVHGLRRLLPPY